MTESVKRKAAWLVLAAMLALLAGATAGMELASAESLSSAAGAVAADVKITGIVSLAGGMATSGQVTASLPGQNQSVGGAPIQPNGTFTLTLPAGNYDLRANVEGYFPLVKTGIGATSDLVVDFDLGSASPRVIAGRVSGLSAEQLTGVWIGVQDSALIGPGPSGGTRPDSATGDYALHVPNGSWRVMPSPVQGKVTPQPRVVSVQGANVSGQDFAYQDGFTITGLVTLKTGPAGFGRIDVYQQGQNFPQTGAQIQPNGRYTITLPAGDYRLQTAVDAYFPSGVALSVPPAPAGTVDFDLAAADAFSISGAITGLSASQLGQLSIWVQDSGQMGPGPSAGVRPDGQSGAYTIHVPNGSWRLMPGQVPGKVSPPARVVPVQGANVTGENFAYQDGFTVSGLVTLKSGPATFGFINIFAQGQNYPFTGAQIQQGGRYSITLPAGSYQLQTSVDSYFPISAALSLPPAPSGSVDFDLAAANPYSISGTATGLTSQELSNLWISVQNSAQMGPGPNTGTRPSSTSGSYLVHIPSGSWRLMPGQVPGKVTPQSRVVEVQGGSVTGQDFAYQAGFPVSGLVTVKNGPAAFGSISAYGLGEQHPIAGAQIQSSGRYTITMPAGAYRLEANVEGYFPLSADVTLPAGPGSVDFNLAAADPFSISGRVTGLSGEQLGNLWIYVQRSDQMGPGPGVGVRPNSATGVYSVNLPNGSWRVMPGQVTGRVTPPPLIVSIDGADVSGQDFVFEDGFTVDGHVAVKAGDPYRGYVNLLPPGRDNSSIGAQLQGDGSFSFVAPAGSYDLQVNVDGYYAGTRAISLTQNTTVNFDLASADPYTVVGSVSGLSGLSESQWNNLMVNAQLSSQNGPGAMANARPLRATGVFTVNVPAGRWRVNAPQVAGYVTPPAQEALVSADQPGAILLPFSFTTGHTISGTVTINGQPVEAWQGHVDAFESATSKYVAGGPIGNGGAYAVTLASGSYALRAQVSGYFPASVSFPNLSGNQPNTNFELGSTNPYTISGRILGLSQEKLAQVSIWAQQASLNGPGPSAWVQPDRATGSYSLRMPAGDWRVMASPVSGYGRPEPVTIALSSQSPTATVDLAFVAGFSVVGTVFDPAGNPLPRAGLHLYNQDHSIDQFNGANDQGRYEFGGLQNGTFTLEPMTPWGADGLLAPGAETVVISGTSVTRDITFTMATKHIVGTIRKTSPSGPVVPGAQIFANKDEGRGGVSGRSDENGAFQLAVGPGTWRINIQPDFGNATPDWTYNGMPAVVTFTDDGSHEQQTVDFIVEVADASVTGIIVRPDGTPPQGGYFSLHSPQGHGGAPIQQGGRFLAPVRAGTYQVHIFANDPRLSMPISLTSSLLAVGSGETKDLGVIRLVQRSATIAGRVTRSDTGGAVAGVGVHAHAVGGNDWADARTDSNGNYTLWVSAGWWHVSATPLPEDPYAGAEGMEVQVVDNQATTLNIQLTPADAVIVGRTVLATDPSVAVTNVFGGAFAFEDGAFRPASSAPLQGGTFTIRVPAGTWRVGVGLPPNAGYSMFGEAVSVTVGSGATANVRIPLARNDATLSGTLRLYPNGEAVTGLAAQIFAGNGRGGGSMASLNVADGTYTLSLSAGTWQRSVQLPPNAGYIVRRGQQMAVTLNAGESVVADIQLETANRSVSGTVTTPEGLPLPDAFIVVEDPARGGEGRFVASAKSDQAGRYAISLPAGSYLVRANVRFDRGYLAPMPVLVDTTAGDVSGVDFAFRQSSATLSGRVTLDGNGMRAMVRAHGDQGGGVVVFTDDSGWYALPLAEGAWQVEAVSHDQTTFYKSAAITLTLSTGTTEQNLALVAFADLPAAASFVFDATAMQVIRLSDGTELRIPAGALANAGQVTLSAAPKPEVPAQGGIMPVSLAYDLRVVDGNGQMVTQFRQNVIIVLQYTDAQLAALGITEDDLIASYWDETTSSWRPVSNMSLDRDNNTVSIAVDHFTDYALTTTTSNNAPEQATVMGGVTLQGREAGSPSNAYSILLRVSLYAPGSASATYSTTLQTDTSAHFALSNIPAGTYTVTVKGSHTLATTRRNVILGGGQNNVDMCVLLEGDADDNSGINITDFSILVSAYGKSAGDAAFDPRGDFNNSSQVNIRDFSLLAANFGKHGAQVCT